MPQSSSSAAQPAHSHFMERVPRPPVFSTAAEERRHRKERLAGAFRLFAEFGFDEGVAGHITARDPERLDHFWVNPLGMNFKQIRVKDLLLVDDRGEVVEGSWAWHVRSMVMNHHAASSTVWPTVSRPWFERMVALWSPRAWAMRLPSSWSSTTPV